MSPSQPAAGTLGETMLDDQDDAAPPTQDGPGN
jgi:hypothetical protein